MLQSVTWKFISLLILLQEISHYSNVKKMNQNGDNYYHGVDEDNTAAMSIYEFEENDQDYQFCNVNRKKSKTKNLGSTIKNPYEIKKQQKQQGHKKRNVPTIKTVNNNNKRRTENKTDQPQERSNHPNFKDTDSTQQQQQQQQQMDLLEILPQAIAFDTRVLLTFEGNLLELHSWNMVQIF